VKTYVLKPRPPVRAFALGAIVSMVGAGVTVLAASQGWSSVVVILGVVVMVAGLALVVGGIVSMWTMRVFVDLDEEGFHIHGPGVDARKAWKGVTKVSLSGDESHVVFAHGEVERTHLFCPSGPGDEQFEALLADISKHLDRSRGYRNVM